jgi:hypothetical protein
MARPAPSRSPALRASSHSHFAWSTARGRSLRTPRLSVACANRRRRPARRYDRCPGQPLRGPAPARALAACGPARGPRAIRVRSGLAAAPRALPAATGLGRPYPPCPSEVPRPAAAPGGLLPVTAFQSGRQDLNLRPPGPQPASAARRCVRRRPRRLRLPGPTTHRSDRTQQSVPKRYHAALHRRSGRLAQRRDGAARMGRARGLPRGVRRG